ncbi:MAG: CHAT domain-containing protein [Dehalococcoidia bacterium]
MTTTAPPSPAADLVARLLAAKTPERRRALIARPNFDPAALRDAAMQLFEEADRHFASDAVLMERLCDDALALAVRSGDEYTQALVRMRSGDAMRAQGRYAEACALFDEARAVFLRLCRPVEAARTRIGWAECASRLGMTGEVLRATRQAQRVFASHGESLRAGRLAFAMVWLHIEDGSWRAALRWSSTALRLNAALGEAGAANTVRARQNRAVVLGRLGRHREALAELEIVKRAFARSGEIAGSSHAWANTGDNLRALGRHAEALQAFDTALRLVRTVGIGRRDVATMLRKVADCYLALNRPEEVIVLLDDRSADIEATEAIQDVFRLATRRVIALRRLGRFDEAAAALADVTALLPGAGRDDRAWLAVQRATLHLEAGEAEQAITQARSAQGDAQAVGSRPMLAAASLIEANAALATGSVATAEIAARRALRMARIADAAPLLYQAHELLGRVAERKTRLCAAERHYSCAVAQLEREQQGVIFEHRDAFASSRGLAYARLAALQVDDGRASAAFITAERAKSRALADAIGRGLKLRPRGSATARSIARQLDRAREDYAAACADRLPIDGERSGSAGGTLEAATELSAREVHISRLVQRLQIAGAGDGESDLYAPPTPELPVLPEGTALIEFFYVGDDLLRFFCDGAGMRAERLKGAVLEVERLVRVLRMNLEAVERCGTAALGGLEAQARGVLLRLNGLLFGGLDELTDLRSLVVVPHGALHYLPFHALYDGEHYLIERLSISYAPSAALYAICRARHPRRGGALIMGHSDRGRLPATLGEAAAVGAVLGVTPRFEEQATRAVLEADGRLAAVIHVAAHAEFRAETPLFSRIELADGPLTTADVFNLRLRAGLVTLSACETGRGALGGGDELAGLVRAFLYAGVAGLMVSQWRIEDATTAELMQRFYRELMGGAGKATALRTAQRALIESAAPGGGRSHPYFWAGFQIIGDDAGLHPLRRRAKE